MKRNGQLHNASRTVPQKNTEPELSDKYTFVWIKIQTPNYFGFKCIFKGIMIKTPNYLGMLLEYDPNIK